MDTDICLFCERQLNSKDSVNENPVSDSFCSPSCRTKEASSINSLVGANNTSKTMSTDSQLPRIILPLTKDKAMFIRSKLTSSIISIDNLHRRISASISTDIFCPSFTQRSDSTIKLNLAEQEGPPLK